MEDLTLFNFQELVQVLVELGMSTKASQLQAVLMTVYLLVEVANQSLGKQRLSMKTELSFIRRENN
jgi:hypothetical protein